MFYNVFCCGQFYTQGLIQPIYLQPEMSETNYLTTKEVAQLCRVSDATVKRWEDAGLLKSERTCGKHRRFRADEVARFQRMQGLGL